MLLSVVFTEKVAEFRFYKFLKALEISVSDFKVFEEPVFECFFPNIFNERLCSLISISKFVKKN